MPALTLPHNIESWKRSFTKSGSVDIQSAKFESGSKFRYESVLHLRVLHTVVHDRVLLHVPSGYKGTTQWIDNLDIFPIARRIEAEDALRGSHFEGLLKAIKKPATKRPRIGWSADAFVSAGSFGPFLSLLALIEQDSSKKEAGGSAVTYYDISPPIASRTRFRQTRPLLFETPTKKNLDLTDSFQGLYFESQPGTAKSYEEPPSAQTLPAEYDEDKVNVQDEQTVNQCLINLMLPITWVLGISGNIDPQRQAFTVFLDGAKAYEARVDGIVTHPKSRTEIVGILEVKKGYRTHEVRLQEAAQMVGLMSQVSANQDSKDGVKRRWLVSMCANELFITIGTCQKPYLEYLPRMEKPRHSAEEVTEEDFLHLEEYGPYRIKYYTPLVAALAHLYILLSNT